MDSSTKNINIETNLKTIFGFDTFRNGQKDVIERLIANKSSLAVFPTGAGKSLCFQLPALMKDGLTLVISPLIALMKDQIDFLSKKKIPAARLDSTLTRDELIKTTEDLKNGKIKLLYISPERLNNERFQNILQKINISLLAVDEAHCISEWGHNFRPDYLKIAKFSKKLKVDSVLALTATATPKVCKDIAKEFNIKLNDIIHTGFYRKNLNLKVSSCNGVDRKELLISRIKNRIKGATIVYVTLQKTAEELAEFLLINGFKASCYHAGMAPKDRSYVQDNFMKGKDEIVVATIAFGMGVDKSDIRYIYHYNLPKGPENYMQEIGRAGRDGLNSICELFASPDDVTRLENFSYGDTPDDGAVEGIIKEILNNDKVFDISTYSISYTHDVRQLVVKTMLTYLELEGIIQATRSFYTDIKFKPNKPIDQIFSKFNKERSEFLKKIFTRAKKGREWFNINLLDVSNDIKESNIRITNAFSYLDEKGEIELQVKGFRQQYKITKKPENLNGLIKKIIERFKIREKSDIDRINLMIDFSETKGCLTAFLINYFGEDLKNCGHCSCCDGEAPQKLIRYSYKTPNESDKKKIEKILYEKHDALKSKRQIARFLCGITSPLTTRKRLTKHEIFGILNNMPFKKVLEFVNEIF